VLIAGRRLAVLGAITAVLAATMSAASAAAPHGRPVYIQLGYQHGQRLVRLDPNTFEPLAERVVQLGDATHGRALAPNARTLALGAESRGKVYIVDLARFARVRTIQVFHRKRDLNPQLVTVSWPHRHLLIGYSEHFEAHESNPARVVLIDPQRRHDVRTIALHGSIVAARHTLGGRAVFIVSPVTHIGASRLVVVGRNGRVRSVTLRFKAGLVDPGDAPESQDLEPGLAVSDLRALVVGLHHTIASIDLHSLHVTYHHVPQLLRARLPEGPPSDGEGSAGALHSAGRSATHIGEDRLLVTGGEQDPIPGKDASRFVQRVPSIVNLRTWRVRRAFHGVSDVTPLGRLWVGSPQLGHNVFAQPRVLDVFSHDGTVINRIRLRRHRTVHVIGNRLFIGGQRFRASAVEVDPRTGRTIRRLARGSKWQSRIVIWQP
jgi:hypothetical protein